VRDPERQRFVACPDLQNRIHATRRRRMEAGFEQTVQGSERHAAHLTTIGAQVQAALHRRRSGCVSLTTRFSGLGR
jgi:RNA:NAD 2'-phosphotransferase (TPT1/KptA family)